MSKKLKLTPWFKGVKPARVGVYQQKNTVGQLGYQRWDGKYWYAWSETAASAERDGARAASSYQNDPWRGLAKNPAPGAAHE